jgi:hypothetical protein
VLVDIRLSQYDSVDLRGIPVPHENTTVWCVPSTIPFIGNPAFDHVRDTQPIVLFTDEINSAQPATFAVAYQLINDRRVGEHVLRPNVIVIAAGNRESDRGITTRMPLPLANRFTHVEVVPDVNQWCFDYAQQAGLSPIGIAYLQFQKGQFMTFDPQKPDKAFATPRTWEKALRYFADDQMPDAIKAAAIAGVVGEGVGAQFLGFVKVYRQLPSKDRILKDPRTAPVPDEASARYATAVSLSGHLDTTTSTALCAYMQRLDPEFTVLFWQLATKRDDTLHGLPEYIAFARTHAALF